MESEKKSRDEIKNAASIFFLENRFFHHTERASGNNEMSRPISFEEVATYVDALIFQYIEKKGTSELPQRIASLKIQGDESNDKLLPALGVRKDHKFDTVLENIIYQHLARAFDDREVDLSSTTITIQRRTSISVPRSSLKSLPSLPGDASESSTNTSPKRQTTIKRPTTVSTDGFTTPTKVNGELVSPERQKSCKTSPFVRKRSSVRRDHTRRPNTAPAGVFTITSASNSRSGKSRSKESWIPDHIREKMVQRDLSVAKQNLALNNMYHHSTDGMSPFERNLTKEKFGLATRKACGLCCRDYLPNNLVMSVPLKAVFDMRDTWGDKFDPDGQKSRIVNVNPNLKRAPACYDRTRVCAFCSQLFDDPDIYRPSIEAKEAERERALSAERERTHAVMSDPLKRMDDERAHEILDSENEAPTDVACT
jgi:hypothetical protein